TLGDVWLDFGEMGPVEEYRRELSLDSAIARTTYRAGGVEIRREVFASKPDEVGAIRVGGGEPGCPAFTVKLNRPEEAATGEPVGCDGLRRSGQAAHEDHPAGVRFEARLLTRSEGGRVSAAGGALRVEGGRSVTILVTSATDYGGGDPEREALADLQRAGGRDYADLRARHVADHQRLYDALRLSLGSTDAATSGLPTDQRLERVGQGAADADLAELYFQYGRYLLIG